ncbi:hypothetical protein [Sphingosinithalassobacter portus]|uniref:hypothetical protein n=1 Tax=Stakelama portus TaxID=2676234 RepID=UPI000D6E1CB9|nr:hypothetical protein [Sphingosinithalassobacter portus]
MTVFTMLVLALVTLYCFARGITDFRAGRRYWGTIGIMLGLGLALIPMPQTVVSIDIPARTQARQ